MAGPDRLAEARAAAAACGVTRLADITGLDRVGAPVFHAIRPLSRALCVHQGKGLTPEAAQLGALMEAVESAHAEAFDVRSCVAPLRDLLILERPVSLGDFACERDCPVGDDELIAWTTAERLIDGQAVQVPFDCVSLDCVRPWDRRLDHTSTGLAARFDFEGAALKGLLEVLERDATVAWRSQPLARRALQSIDCATIAYPWFQALSDRLAEAEISLWLYRMPTLIGLPAIYAEAHAHASDPRASARSGGWACEPKAEDALLGAVLEALQCRLTVIAGARDDILHGGAGLPPSEACPLPPNLSGVEWGRVVDAEPDAPAVTARWIAERLAALGYPDASAVKLSAPDAAVCVVKVFAPGLGANLRARRQPMARAFR
jgi:ribosomal protein S12 methylthiotransferase accessory factor